MRPEPYGPFYYYERARGERRMIQEWIDIALSEQVREFRLVELGKAFGLGVHYLRNYLANETGMGCGLRREIIEWCDDNPDLAPNMPSTGDHWFSTLGDLG